MQPIHSYDPMKPKSHVDRTAKIIADIWRRITEEDAYWSIPNFFNIVRYWPTSASHAGLTQNDLDWAAQRFVQKTRAEFARGHFANAYELWLFLDNQSNPYSYEDFGVNRASVENSIGHHILTLYYAMKRKTGEASDKAALALHDMLYFYPYTSYILTSSGVEAVIAHVADWANRRYQRFLQSGKADSDTGLMSLIAFQDIRARIRPDLPDVCHRLNFTFKDVLK